MTQLTFIKQALNYTYQNQMHVINKLLDKVPAEKVDFRPCDHAKSYSLGDLISHMYEMVFACCKAVRKGSLTQEDFTEIPIPQPGASLDEIRNYINIIRSYFKETIENLTEQQLNQQVVFHCWHGMKLTGLQSIMTITEEIPHHRGQLTLYLRLMGISLPIGFIYDFS